MSLTPHPRADDRASSDANPRPFAGWTRLGIWGAAGVAGCGWIYSALASARSGPAWGWLAASTAATFGTWSAWKFRRQLDQAALLREESLSKDNWLDSLMENPALGIFVLDERGGVTAINSAAEKLVGYSANEAVGRLR